MKRTQVYLTEQQQKAIAQRAADAGVSRAEVVRRVLDEGLGLDSGAGDRVAAIDATAGLLSDAQDWPAWLKRVRGKGADGRLRDLGT